MDNIFRKTKSIFHYGKEEGRRFRIMKFAGIDGMVVSGTWKGALPVSL
jgi:hypothetical protein